jgi:hypothetical protein
MRALLLASTFLFLVLGNVAKAEQIYLICKLVNAHSVEKDGRVFSSTEKLKKELSDDIIILNTKKKKIEKGPFLPENEKLISWGKDSIIWSTQVSKQTVYNLNLDRNTGALTKVSANPYVTTTLNYKCNRENNIKF